MCLRAILGIGLLAVSTSLQAAIQYELTTIQSGAAGSALNNDGAVVGTYGRDAFWWTPSGGFHRDVRVSDNWGADINSAGVMIGHTKTTFTYGQYSRFSTFAYNVWTGQEVSQSVRRVDKSIAINDLNLTAGSEWSYDAPSGSHYVGYSYDLAADGSTVVGRS